MYIWLNDKIKRFVIDILIDYSIEIVLIFFKIFLNDNEYKNNKIIRLRVDNNEEYINNVFVDFRIKRNIYIEFIIVENF